MHDYIKYLILLAAAAALAAAMILARNQPASGREALHMRQSEAAMPDEAKYELKPGVLAGALPLDAAQPRVYKTATFAFG